MQKVQAARTGYVPCQRAIHRAWYERALLLLVLRVRFEE